jgi:hypothetical protein
MKYFLILSVFLSTAALAEAQLGQGAKAGCNPSEWACDTACQARKAKACGLALSEDRTMPEIRTKFEFSSKGKKKGSME